MHVLERIWEILGVFFGGILRGVERAITSMFGSSNARYIKKLQHRVDAINALEPKFMEMSDDELKEQTAKFKQRLSAGETLDDLLVETFAVNREAGRRFLNMRHYDVQLVGGMVLHGGAIAEMVTGEGKTLVATLPAYLNALEGHGVHIVTVNDYLARRDMEWMGPVYLGLGLTVGAIQNNMESPERQKAYSCDITYGTNNEFGFDYLRDNMRPAARGDDNFRTHYQQSQGPLRFAIIDEVDNILIDEARTPLIISGPAHDNVRKYADADRIARSLKKDKHFVVNEKDHTANLTDDGVREAERLAGVETFYTAGNMEWPHLIDNSLRAHYLYKRDVNYVVEHDGVVIVDEHTGRKMEGRQWSDGLHQAVEAKEGVKIKEETQTLATITLQNFFKLYDKICGMTGTAMTEASEFWKIYKLDVIAIPTNRPLRRLEHPDVIYQTEKEKYEAVADEIERLNRWDVLLMSRRELWGTVLKEDDDSVTFQEQGSKEKQTISKSKIDEIEHKGRPVLVGTVSIEKSERLSALLDQRGIKHEVLNAKYHKREADIVAQAGRFGAVTVATNMAGRGTDIVLGGNPETMAWARLQDTHATRLDVPKDEWQSLVKEIEEEGKMKEQGARVKELGGLHVIGTERHDARRIDLQLRGRTGRQGDPGSSRFFLCLDDDLMRIFAGEWVKKVLSMLGMKEGERIESKMVTRRIEGAQKKREEYNFEVRKNLLEYDEVMDEQRKRVYGYRQKVLDGVNCRDLILEMITEQIDHHIEMFLARDFGVETFANWAQTQLAMGQDSPLDPRHFRGLSLKEAVEIAKDEAVRACESDIFQSVEENLPDDEDADKGDWNWASLAKFANSRWGLNLRDRDLKKVGREGVSELLIEKAREAINAIDLSEGESFLEADFSIKSALDWAHHRFGIELKKEDICKHLAVTDVHDIEPAPLKQFLTKQAEKIYDDKEAEYPVLAGLYRYSTTTSSGQPRIDREGLVSWAKDRFEVDLELEDLKNKQREDIRAVLIDHSRRHQEMSKQTLADGNEKLQSLLQGGQIPPAEGNGELASMSDWLLETLKCELTTEEMAAINAEQLQQRMVSAVGDRFHPEMRRMERQLVLDIVDSSWKDHLLAMDYLRAAVRLKGWAQLDPKVEYKRLGMKQFDEMWTSIGDQVTDLIFRMEQMPEDYVGNTWVETEARHDEAQTEMARQQQEAIDGSQGDGKMEPIRNRGEQVGRNDPCPCNSGKKYKKCCMRKETVT